MKAAAIDEDGTKPDAGLLDAAMVQADDPLLFARAVLAAKCSTVADVTPP